VADVEILGGFFLDGDEDALAFVEVHVGNAGVEAEGVVVSAEGPDMHVMNFEDALDGEHGAGYVFHGAIAGTAFEEDVGGFAEDADAGPEDEQADGKTEEWVDPAKAGGANDNCADDDGDVGESVTEIVDQDAAQVEITAATH